MKHTPRRSNATTPQPRLLSEQDLTAASAGKPLDGTPLPSFRTSGTPLPA